VIRLVAGFEGFLRDFFRKNLSGGGGCSFADLPVFLRRVLEKGGFGGG
jgi:hypothetical protein